MSKLPRPRKRETYFGKKNTGGGPVTRRDGPPVLIQHGEGGVTETSLSMAILELSHRKAVLVDGKKKPLPRVMVVLCRRNRGVASMREPRIGKAVEAVDPGRKHLEYILLLAQPISMSKDVCKAIGACRDTDLLCGTCCNNKQKRR